MASLFEKQAQLPAQFAHHCTYRGQLAALKLILNGHWIEPIADLVCMATRGCHVDVLEHLLDMGAPMVLDGCNVAMVTAAAKNVYLDCMKVLTNRGADVNMPDGSGNTPLLVAARESQNEIIRFLVSFPMI